MSYNYGINVHDLKKLQDKQAQQNGIYAIGQVNYNPMTGDTFYWAKVGLSSDLYQRLRYYLKHAPMTYIANVMFIAPDGTSNWSRAKKLESKSYELRVNICKLFDFDKVAPTSSFTQIMEGVCHHVLKKICLTKGAESTEWFLLKKEDYMAFCESFDSFIYSNLTEEETDALCALTEIEKQSCFTYYDLISSED